MFIQSGVQGKASAASPESNLVVWLMDQQVHAVLRHLLLNVTKPGYLSPSAKTAPERLQVYLQYASKHGCLLSAAEVLANYRRAFAAPWDKSPSRYVADGRDFWRFVVSQSTLVDDEACFEAIYAHYARAEAWSVAPGAHAALASLKSAGAARKHTLNQLLHA